MSMSDPRHRPGILGCHWLKLFLAGNTLPCEVLCWKISGNSRRGSLINLFNSVQGTFFYRIADAPWTTKLWIERCNPWVGIPERLPVEKEFSSSSACTTAGCRDFTNYIGSMVQYYNMSYDFFAPSLVYFSKKCRNVTQKLFFLQKVVSDTVRIKLTFLLLHIHVKMWVWQHFPKSIEMWCRNFFFVFKKLFATM